MIEKKDYVGVPLRVRLSLILLAATFQDVGCGVTASILNAKQSAAFFTASNYI
jgi:hypothetical protein